MSTTNHEWRSTLGRPYYRIGFFWPIVLIGLGLVLLLSNMNVLTGNVGELLWRLWPVILVAWGLDALLRREFVSAALLVGLGGIFLLSSFGYLTVSIWEILVRLWPLFIISAGVGLIFNRGWMGTLGGVVGGLIMLAVLIGAVWLIGGRLGAGVNTAESLPAQRFVQPMEDVKQANIALNPAAGALSLQALPGTSNLLEGNIGTQGQGNGRFNQAYSVENGVANLTLKSEAVVVGIGPMAGYWPRWDLGVNPGIPIALKVNMGAGEVNLDLSGVKVSDLDVNMAVGSATITLPHDTLTNARLSHAIGSTTLIVPPDVGVQIRSSGGLSAVDVPPSYTQEGNTYTSPNFASAAKQITIRVSEAIGALTVREQTGR